MSGRSSPPDEPPAGRIDTLDIVRGVAVLGILTMNISSFALPVPAYSNPRAFGGTSALDLATWAVDFILFDGRMRGLFSVLFGASLLLVADRAEDSGRSAWRVHVSRMAWLFVLGLTHLLLVWDGDILTHYAIVGLVAFAFRRHPPMHLCIASGLLLAFTFVLTTTSALGLFAAAGALHDGSASPAIIHAYARTVRSYGLLAPEPLANMLALHHGPWGNAVAARWLEAPGLIGQTLAYVGVETLAYMLLGMAALRTGLLTGQWTDARYARWAAAAFAVTVPAYALLAWWQWASGFAVPVVVAATVALTTPLRTVGIAGWACLIIRAARRRGWLARRLAAAGRMAFTNYIATSIVCVGLFDGVGLYATIGRAQLAVVVLAVWLLILGWSQPWLRHFRYGPLEWLWRSLARFRLQPMRGPAV